MRRSLCARSSSSRPNGRAQWDGRGLFRPRAPGRWGAQEDSRPSTVPSFMFELRAGRRVDAGTMRRLAPFAAARDDGGRSRGDAHIARMLGVDAQTVSRRSRTPGSGRTPGGRELLASRGPRDSAREEHPRTRHEQRRKRSQVTPAIFLELPRRTRRRPDRRRLPVTPMSRRCHGSRSTLSA